MGNVFSFAPDVYELIRSRYRNTGVEVNFVKHYASKPGAFILDLGCGTGTLLRELGKVGFRGIGVEPSKSFVSYGNQEISKAGIPQGAVFIVEGRAEDFDPPDGIDIAICNFNTLSYLPDIKSIRALFQHLSQKLGKESVFIVEFAYYLRFMENFKEFLTVNHTSDDMHVMRQIRHVVRPARAILIHEENVFVNRVSVGLEHSFERHEELIITPPQVIELLRDANLEIIESWSSWRMKKELSQSSTCTLVCRPAPKY